MEKLSSNEKNNQTLEKRSKMQLMKKLNDKLDNYFIKNNINIETKSDQEQTIILNIQKLKMIQNLEQEAQMIKNENNNQQINLQNFHQGKILGSGQYGDVSIVIHKKSNMIFALKTIQKKQINNPKCKNQIKDEIKNQIYLQHPNIIKLYAVFHDQSNVYMIMEYANQGIILTLLKLNLQIIHILNEGQMYQILKKLGRFEEKKVVYYLKQIISALQYMHYKNILHRDLKAENILLSNDVIKLCDFGWSAQYNQRQRNSFCGTLDYVPPEVIRGEAQQTQLDVWTLGVLAYELVCGYAPFETNNKEQTLAKIQIGNYQFPYHVSPLAQDFIKKLLKQLPQDRMTLEEMLIHPWFQIDLAK